MKSNYAVILCGGSGTRLWPLSRSLRPKQLLPLNGEETLLQQTARRLLQHVVPANLLTVTHQDHRFDVKGQLSEVDPQLVAGVLAEPVARNTLPAVAWAAYTIFKRDPEAIVGIFPSDHAIGDDDAFLSAWKAAESAALQGYLTLIGISPTKSATGYGYIQPGMEIENSVKGVFSVCSFIEKPDGKRAERFVADGYLWNGGMFVFRVRDFMQLLEQHQPEIFQCIVAMGAQPTLDCYQSLRNLSIDYGIAEKAEKIAVVPADMGWSDLGDWDSIYQHQVKDAAGNLVQGDVLSLDTRGSLLWTSHGVLATLGISDLIIVQTADVTLVCDRNHTENIKQLVSFVQETHPHLTETHLTVHRPWGTYTVLEEGAGFKIKRIEVKPGASLSLQLHYHRSEHWVVVSGAAKVTNGETEILINTNESTYIPAGKKHRLKNSGVIPCVIIEVQTGEYVGEDDIVRFDDVYGRHE